MGVKIIIAGGGTGGHIFPAVAIAHALRRLSPGIEILFVGAKGKMEMEKVPQAGYEIRGIDIAGFNRSSLIRNIGLPIKLVKSFFQVRGIVKSFRPDAVIGVGGYSTFPVLRYAQAKKIPTFIHEANSFAGKANMMLGKKATKIFVATDGMEKFFPASKIMISGNPVRDVIANSSISRDEGIQFFNLSPAKKTILVSGGSLGAKGINEAIAAHIEEFEKNDVQLIWQTGKPFANQAQEISKGKKNIWTGDFISKMEYAYAGGDAVVSRAGAMTIAELCVVKKAVVFVPFPYAAENHQTVNAQKLVNVNAAIMIRDSDAKEQLVPALIELVRNETRRLELMENISALGVKDADEIVAKEVLKTITTVS